MDKFAFRTYCNLLNEQIYETVISDDELLGYIIKCRNNQELLQCMVYHTPAMGKYHQLYSIIYAFSWYENDGT